MHFVKLRLSGFKSFVDQTELHIQPGLTGVIGPNGCGKSNLLEALRWVMGETSAKSMRGAGMEDVIFAGAATRTARNFAEVALTIDNTERRAPAAFNSADTLEISRRITRDQGSNYKYNGKDIRARDAQTLFADASTGANSPALVRQGQISELINAKPKARRRVLEEAAGIAGLHARRHEATLRLNNAEANLERVIEILSQLEAREATLQREAKRAQEYRDISAKLRLAEAILLYRRWREASRDYAGAKTTLEDTTSAAGQAAQKAAEAARAKIEFDEKIPKLREEEAIARAIHQKLLIEREALATKEREAQATAARLEQQLRQFAQDRTREATIREDANRMAENIAVEIGALEGSGDLDAGPEIETARAAETEAEERVAAAEHALDQLTSDVATMEAERKSQAARAEEARRTLARFEQENLAAQAQKATLEGERAAALEARDEAQSLFEEAQMTIAEAEESAAEAEEARAEAQDAETAYRAELAELNGAVKALGAEATQLEQVLADRPVAGEPLLDRVRAADGSELALGAALGDELQAGEAASGGYGWLTLPPLDTVPPLPAGATRLADAVEAPPALARRLALTGLVDRADGFRLHALLLPGQRLVSHEGDLWRWDGYAVSADDAPSAAALRLQQQNRLDLVRTQLAEAEQTLGEKQSGYDAAKSALTNAQTRETATREARRRAEQEVGTARSTATKAEGEIASLDAKLGSLAQILTGREGDGDAARDTLAEAEAFLESAADAETA
ncbi:MAG: AAA family ATPase, partial [Pseudomonadota bacterium]